jgi:hypothetical protein
MKARQLLNRRVVLEQNAFAELIVWQLSHVQPGSAHQYKYRLAFVVGGECVLRYDNETGKGDHRHRSGRETSYDFTSVDALVKDFFNDVTRWRNENDL